MCIQGHLIRIVFVCLFVGVVRPSLKIMLFPEPHPYIVRNCYKSKYLIHWVRDPKSKSFRIDLSTGTEKLYH